MTVIFGTSGHAKEVAYLLQKVANRSDVPSFFISNEVSTGTESSVYMHEDVFLEKILTNSFNASAYVAIGSGAIREKIIAKFAGYDNINFANLVSIGVEGDFANIYFDSGNILFPGVQLTTNISIGKQNHFNLNVSVSHDCTIGNYNSFSPGVRIAGKVNIGNNNFFGLGATVIDNLSIGDNIIIGAGAVVTKNLLHAGTYVGVPAKRIK